MPGLVQDLSFAVRMLLKQPAYTIVAVLTLAVAIGANTAIFSAVNALMLRPLPFPEADRLVVVVDKPAETDHIPIPYLNAIDYRDANATFSGLALYSNAQVDLTDRGESERVGAEMVSRDLLPVLGVAPALGRNFTAEEDAPNGPRAVILHHGLWRGSSRGCRSR